MARSYVLFPVLVGLIGSVACARYRTATMDTGSDAGADAATGTEGGLGSLLGPPADLGADAYGAAVRVDRPIAWFRFDEPRNATTLADAVGSRQASVGAGTTTGRKPLIATGYALALDGTGGSSFPDLSFDGTAPFTIEIWFLATRIDEVFRRLVAHEYEPGAPGWQGFNLSLSAGKLEFDRIVDGTPCGPAHLDASALVPGTHHVVATFDGTQSTLYLDGRLEAALPCASHLVDLPAYSGYFGRTENGSSFEGALDEAAFYDYALSLDRIEAHYVAGQPPDAGK